MLHTYSYKFWDYVGPVCMFWKFKWAMRNPKRIKFNQAKNPILQIAHHMPLQPVILIHIHNQYKFKWLKTILTAGQKCTLHHPQYKELKTAISYYCLHSNKCPVRGSMNDPCASIRTYLWGICGWCNVPFKVRFLKSGDGGWGKGVETSFSLF